MSRWIVVLTISLFVLVACESEAPRPVATKPDDPLTYVDYSCYGSQPAYHLRNPYRKKEIPKGAWEAFITYKTHYPGGEAPTEAVDWIGVVRKRSRVDFLREGDYPHAYFWITMMRKQGRWRDESGGDCKLWATSEGESSSSDWWLAASPQPEDEHLAVRASERDCTGGRKLGSKDFHPRVHYEPERISIVVYAKPLKDGAYECPGNPSTPFTIALSEPVGDRDIIDVGVYPPREARTNPPKSG